MIFFIFCFPLKVHFYDLCARVLKEQMRLFLPGRNRSARIGRKWKRRIRLWPAIKMRLSDREAWKFRARNTDGERVGTSRIDALNAKSISTVESWDERGIGEVESAIIFPTGHLRLSRKPRLPRPFTSPVPYFPPFFTRFSTPRDTFAISLRLIY